MMKQAMYSPPAAPAPQPHPQPPVPQQPPAVASIPTTTLGDYPDPSSPVSPKEVAEQKPVMRRSRSREGQPSSPRPKSWHANYKVLSQPDLTQMAPPNRNAEPAQPSYRNPPPTGYNQFQSASESSFMNSSYSEKTNYRLHGRSTGSLNNNMDEEPSDPLPGHVQKKREVFERSIMSQSVDKINEEHYDNYSSKRIWKEKQIITQGVNPRLRNIGLEIEPAETYPKVVMATQISSAQSKAVLGRVPDMDLRGQRYGSVQDVSIHTVQMPQRQMASSADSSVTRNYAQAHSNFSSNPQTSYVQSTFGTNTQVGNVSHQGDGKYMERRVPPAIPKREDSKAKTQTLSEHMKSSSWPVSTANPENTNTITVTQTILPSDLPPVKLNPNPDKGPKSPPVSVAQPNPNKNSNSTTQDIFKARPVWSDYHNDDLLNCSESKSLDTELKVNTNVNSTNPPSPPVRDNDHMPFRQKPGNPSRSTDDRYLTGDHLIQDYRKYLEQTEQQQEDLRQSFDPGNVAPESQRPLLARTYDLQSMNQPPKVPENPSLAQTMPARDASRWFPEGERQRTRLSVSSQDSMSVSEKEKNRKNITLGQSSDRTWRNPSDKRETEWQQAVKSSVEWKPPQQQVPYQQKPLQQQPLHPKRSNHSRQSSDIDKPRDRSPISPMLMENFELKQELLQKTFTQKLELAVNPPESRDSRKSNIFDRSEGSSQADKLHEGHTIAPTMAFDENNSILGRLKREGSFKNSGLSFEAERSEGNETSAKKVIVPDTKRDLRDLGLTEAVFKHKKGLHYKSESFTHDSRGNGAPDPRLNKTVPTASTHQRTHSIDTAPYTRHPPKRRESVERRGDSRVSRENSFSDRNIADTRRYWKQLTGQEKCSDADKGDHKKSKSDSDQHPKGEPRRKKISDPVNKPQFPRMGSDPENKQQIKDVLKDFMHQKQRSPPGSVSSPLGSRPPSISSSEQSLLHSGLYPSNSSLASYDSRRHYGQDSISSVGSSVFQSMHHPQDSGFGSNSDISQVIRSPNSPPQTGVVSPKDLRAAALITGASVSRSSSISSQTSQYQSGSERERERRKSHQPTTRRASEKDMKGYPIMQQHSSGRLQHQRMSLDSGLPNYSKGHQDKIRQQAPVRISPDRLQPSPTKQLSPAQQFNVHVAERKTITRVQEEEPTAAQEDAIVYESLQMEHAEVNHRVFKFPPTSSSSSSAPVEQANPTTSASTAPSLQRTPPNKTSPSSTFSPSDNIGKTTTTPPNHGVDMSPPPPPTPTTPWDCKDDFPPPPEFVFDGRRERTSPSASSTTASTGLSSAGNKPVQQRTQEGSISPIIAERISPQLTEAVQQAPSSVGGLEVQVDAASLGKVEDTTPSLSPTSISGRSSPDSHHDNTADPTRTSSPQHVPRLTSVPENIPFSTATEDVSVFKSAPIVDAEPVDEGEDEEDGEEEIDVAGRAGSNAGSIFTRAQKRAQREIEELSDPLLKSVLQSLVPDQSALSDLFPLPKSKRSRSLGGTVRMTNMEHSTRSKSETELISEPQSPRECINLVLSSSRYLRISPAKAILLKRAKGMGGAGDDLGNNNTELRKTQEVLVDRISKKLEDIRDLQTEVAEEMSNLEDMGRQVMESVKTHCKASEYNKCNMYIADIERVTKLLLSLSRRLNKVESVLGSLENSEEEEKANLEKLKATIDSQYHDAKMLKESITQRHAAISAMLLAKLSNEQHDNFSYYAQMLPRLLIMGQELEDKVRLGEDQLEALGESLRQMGTSPTAATITTTTPTTPTGLSSSTVSSRDTNGNLRGGYKEERDRVGMSPTSSTARQSSTSSSEDVNSHATSSYC